MDSSGARRELTDADKASLAETPQPTLEAIVEQAFEAGIACVLGDYATPDEDSELNDEAEERRLLLAPLMERAGAHGLLERNLLGRALLATAIQHATAPRTASPEAGQPKHGSRAPANGPRPAAQKNAGLESNQLNLREDRHGILKSRFASGRPGRAKGTAVETTGNCFVY